MTNQSGGISDPRCPVPLGSDGFYALYSCNSRPEWAMARHVGHRPLTRDSRSNLPAEGFEPLTKDSRSNPLTNCTVVTPPGVMIGVVQRGVVIRGELEGSGGSASGWILQNPGLGSQAKEEGEFSM